MKKLSTLLLLLLFVSPAYLFAGGIVTNQNQSVQYVRMVARDASTEIDAVFFNPAGLTKLEDGFYISISNQYISQGRTITSNYPNLNGTPGAEFTGEAIAPLFPDVYAAYKTGEWVISLGINPIGGGGTATFDGGLPAFEMAASDLVPALSSMGVTGYSLDAYLEGSSVYWGYQLGVSYEINDMFSVFAGARYVSAKNTYVGHLNDISINIGGGTTRADDFFNGVIVPNLTGAATNLNNAITAGLIGADDALADATAIGTLTALGLYEAGMTNAEAAATFTGAAAQYTATAALLADQSVDVEQTGYGFTPILGANISFNKFNIGLKYEFKTSMKLENKTAQDFTVGMMPDGTPVTMFPDGQEFHNDMPALLSAGVDYKITDKFLVSAGYHYYFDKNANYGKKLNGSYIENDEIMDKNSWEFALGLQYDISDKFLVSAGYLRTKSGVNETYQSDLSYSLPSNSVGLGAAYKINSSIALNLGVFYTAYEEGDKNFTRTDALGNSVATIETYDKTNLLIGLGLDFKLGGKKKSE